MGFEGVLPYFPYFQGFFVAGFSCRCLALRSESSNWSQNSRTPQRKWVFWKCWGTFTILWSSLLTAMNLLTPLPQLYPAASCTFFAKPDPDNVCWANLSPLGLNFVLELEFHVLLPQLPLRAMAKFQQVPAHPGSELPKGPIPFSSSSPHPCYNLMVPSLPAVPSWLSFHFLLRSISCFSPNFSFCLVNLEGVLGDDSDQQRLWRAPILVQGSGVAGGDAEREECLLSFSCYFGSGMAMHLLHKCLSLTCQMLAVTVTAAVSASVAAGQKQQGCSISCEHWIIQSYITAVMWDNIHFVVPPLKN